MKTILLVEQKPHIRESIIAVLETVASAYKVLTAKNLVEATDVIDMLDIDGLMLGISLNASEIDILVSRLEKKENIKLIVIDNGQTPASEDFGQLKPALVLGVPIQTELLLDGLRQTLGGKYGGQLHGIQLASFLQMIHLESKTCVVFVTAGDRSGQLFLDKGNLIDAKTDRLQGKPAILDILAWPQPNIRLYYQDCAVEKTIRESLMHILLESSQSSDDKKPRCLDMRKYPRFECSQEIMFSIDDLIYRGIVRNVSMGGIYVETGIPISSGKDIMITVSDPGSAKQEFIFGRVVRSTDSGIGVELHSLKANQRKLLRSMAQDANLTDAA